MRRLCERFPAFDTSLQLGPKSQVIEQRELEMASYMVGIDGFGQELQRSGEQIKDDRALLPLFCEASHHLDHVRGVPIRVQIGTQRQMSVDGLRTCHHIEIPPLYEHEL
jgi:hypothetical protein